MYLVVALFTIISICIAFISNHQTGKLLGPLFAYFITEINFILNDFFVFSILFLILIIAFMRTLELDKKMKFYKKFILSAYHVGIAYVFGFLLSYVVLFLIAVIQLNILSITFNINKKALGIIHSPNEVLKSLQTNSRPPEIITTDKNPHKELLAVAFATTGADNFYSSSILQSIPNFLVIPINNNQSGIMLLDNTLIVSEIKAEDIQTLSPVVGYLLVKHYFPTRKIKALPKIAIMEKAEYQQFKKEENAKKIIKIDEELVKLEDKISSVSATIETDKKLLADNQDPATRKKNKININERELQEKIKFAENLLADYKYFDKFYRFQKELLQKQSENAPSEFGIFVPKDTIKIIFRTSSPHAIADYFATLTHEYLHYSSYVSEDKRLYDSFFEEGLTEYFARMTIQNDLNTSTNLGYPVQAKIIKEMTNLIPESEFAEIYFTKDQLALEMALNRVYGDDFYRETQIIFETIQHTGNPQQLLALANNIMKRIGGTPLTEKDLMSSYSKL